MVFASVDSVSVRSFTKVSIELPFEEEAGEDVPYEYTFDYNGRHFSSSNTETSASLFNAPVTDAFVRTFRGTGRSERDFDSETNKTGIYANAIYNDDYFGETTENNSLHLEQSRARSASSLKSFASLTPEDFKPAKITSEEYPDLHLDDRATVGDDILNNRELTEPQRMAVEDILEISRFLAVEHGPEISPLKLRKPFVLFKGKRKIKGMETVVDLDLANKHIPGSTVWSYVYSITQSSTDIIEGKTLRITCSVDENQAGTCVVKNAQGKYSMTGTSYSKIKNGVRMEFPQKSGRTL